MTNEQRRTTTRTECGPDHDHQLTIIITLNVCGLWLSIYNLFNLGQE